MGIKSPDHFKLNGGWTKYALRKSLSNILPDEIAWRKDKKGFSHPGGEWLKKELKDKVMNDYLSGNSKIFKLQIIDKDEFLETYNDFCEQPKNSGYVDSGEIFRCISLEIWLRSFDEFILTA